MVIIIWFSLSVVYTSFLWCTAHFLHHFYKNKLL